MLTKLHSNNKFLLALLVVLPRQSHIKVYIAFQCTRWFSLEVVQILKFTYLQGKSTSAMICCTKPPSCGTFLNFCCSSWDWYLPILSIDTRLPQINAHKSTNMYLKFAERGRREERKKASKRDSREDGKESAQKRLVDSFKFANRLNPEIPWRPSFLHQPDQLFVFFSICWLTASSFSILNQFRINWSVVRRWSTLKTFSGFFLRSIIQLSRNTRLCQLLFCGSEEEATCCRVSVGWGFRLLHSDPFSWRRQSQDFKQANQGFRVTLDRPKRQGKPRMYSSPESVSSSRTAADYSKMILATVQNDYDDNWDFDGGDVVSHVTNRSPADRGSSGQSHLLSAASSVSPASRLAHRQYQHHSADS